MLLFDTVVFVSILSVGTVLGVMCGVLGLHEGGSTVSVLIVELQLCFTGSIFATSLQHRHGRVAAYCLLCGLNQWPNLSALRSLPPLWLSAVAPATQRCPSLLSL